MMRTISPRERRTILLGALAIVAGFLGLYALPRYRLALEEARADVVIQRDLLARELALLEDAERYPAAYRTADSALLRAAPRLFDESDDVLATARLASYVAGQALGTRVLLREAESRPTQRSRDGVRRLQVDILAESDTEGMLRFLNSLERGSKLVVVDRITLTREERTVAKGKPPTAVLLLSATVSGFALADTASMQAVAVATVSRGPQ